MIIEELEIYTSKLEEQVLFYKDILSFELMEQTNKSATFKIGYSILKLTYRSNVKPYHYAINIPSNQIEGAKSWLSSRMDVLKYEGNEIQFFDFWDAYAVYFYDVDDNIVEFIARKNIDIQSEEPFGPNILLGISEMGIPTENIPTIYNFLNKLSGLELFSGSLERFAAIGDVHGLFIVINNKLKKEWFPTTDIPNTEDFFISIVENHIRHKLEFSNGQFSLLE